ncbi:MAG: hypothetical protein EU547_05695 [Promethearchaeota archaeon]|nr:MAG: hypothetical protein EU547_05695 [Candidatus Lokiarchaeota archaeon]
MNSSHKRENDIKFRNFKVDFFHWRILGWLIFTLFATVLYFIDISTFNILGPSIPSVLWLLGVFQIIRFIIQYIYEIPHQNLLKDQKLKKNENKEELQFLPKVKCFGCSKELSPNIFQNVDNNTIEPLKFISLDIKGHFCKKCANSYYYVELMYDSIGCFIIFVVLISIFLIETPGLTGIITTIALMIISGSVFIGVLLFDRIKILKKYQ